MFEREKIAKRLVSAFQIKFESLPDEILIDPNDPEKKKKLKPSEIVIAEFGAYLRNFPYHITGEEILEAYRMASRGELRDFLGNQIQFFPTLSTAQAGRILMAYQEFKIDNQQHTIGINKLKKLMNPEQKNDPEDAKELRRRNWEILLKSVKENKSCDHAFLFFERVIKKGGLKNFISDKNAQSIVIKKKMHSIVCDEKKKVKSVLFNNFEINHLLDYFSSEMLEPRVKFAFEKLQAMATVQVKNDLVYNWLKKEIRKNEYNKNIQK